MIPFDQIAYIKHKIVTVMFESSVFAVWIYGLIKELDSAVQIILTVAAVITAVISIVRQYWEIKTKRREHEIAEIERDMLDQELWQRIEDRKKIKDDDDKSRKSLPAD